ncbi:MAG: hypothetical protein DME98_08195 [Verrucomicrobia bacterium]|nr:MAG: hypothetical protein DME98_08195 [Verrucomicrobiota bacterium]
MTVEMFRGPDHIAMRTGCMIVKIPAPPNNLPTLNFRPPNRRGSCGPNIRPRLTRRTNAN